MTRSSAVSEPQGREERGLTRDICYTFSSFFLSNCTNEQSPGCDLLISVDRMILLLSDKKSSLFAFLVSVYNTVKKFLSHKPLLVIPFLFIYLFLTA